MNIITIELTIAYVTSSGLNSVNKVQFVINEKLNIENVGFSTLILKKTQFFLVRLLIMSPVDSEIIKNNAEMYLKPSLTSMTEHFCENSDLCLALNYFYKNAPSFMLDRVLT